MRRQDFRNRPVRGEDNSRRVVRLVHSDVEGIGARCRRGVGDRELEAVARGLVAVMDVLHKAALQVGQREGMDDDARRRRQLHIAVVNRIGNVENNRRRRVVIGVVQHRGRQRGGRGFVRRHAVVGQAGARTRNAVELDGHSLHGRGVDAVADRHRQRIAVRGGEVGADGVGGSRVQYGDAARGSVNREECGTRTACNRIGERGMLLVSALHGAHDRARDDIGRGVVVIIAIEVVVDDVGAFPLDDVGIGALVVVPAAAVLPLKPVFTGRARDSPFHHAVGVGRIAEEVVVWLEVVPVLVSAPNRGAALAAQAHVEDLALLGAVHVGPVGFQVGVGCSHPGAADVDAVDEGVFSCAGYGQQVAFDAVQVGLVRQFQRLADRNGACDNLVIVTGGGAVKDAGVNRAHDVFGAQRGRCVVVIDVCEIRYAADNEVVDRAGKGVGGIKTDRAARARDDVFGVRARSRARRARRAAEVDVDRARRARDGVGHLVEAARNQAGIGLGDRACRACCFRRNAAADAPTRAARPAGARSEIAVGCFAGGEVPGGHGDNGEVVDGRARRAGARGDADRGARARSNHFAEGESADAHGARRTVGAADGGSEGACDGGRD